MLTLCLSISNSLGQEDRKKDSAELIPGDNRTCVFADQETSFLYSSTADPGDVQPSRNWRVQWTLVAERRILARGNTNAFVPGDSDVPLYLISVPMPPLRTGVVMSVELQTTWTAGDQTYKHSRPLHIFPRDAFASQNEFLQRAQIKLFDPLGKTAELLDNQEIPHTRLTNLTAIDRVAKGIVTVGEGISFRKQKKLAETLTQAARRGISVLCLAPSEGEFPLLAEEDGQKIQPTRLVLEREGFVQQYDKRFDSITSVSTLSLTPKHDEVVIGVDSGPDHWSLISLDFPSNKPKAPDGRVLICSSGIVSHWQTGPVPRYLFAHFLKELSDLSLTEEK